MIPQVYFVVDLRDQLDALDGLADREIELTAESQSGKRLGRSLTVTTDAQQILVLTEQDATQRGGAFEKGGVIKSGCAVFADRSEHQCRGGEVPT